MDKGKIRLWSAICSILFLVTADDASAIVNSENVINPLIAKDILLQKSPVKNSGNMPVYKPYPNIDYKILRMKVDPSIDYKILHTMPSGIFNRKNTPPEFQPDSLFKLYTPRSIPHNPSPEGQPPRLEPPRNK